MIPDRFIRTQADRLFLETEGYWDQSEADKIVSFTEKYVLPKYTGRKFELLPWQRDWLQQLNGWRLHNTRRRWKRCLLTCAKKNGKTLLNSAVALFELYAAGTVAPFVCSLSSTRSNASQIFEEVRSSVEHSERLRNCSKIRHSYKTIKLKTKEGEFRSASHEAGNISGENISYIICDEMWTWPNNKLWLNVEYAICARPNGMATIISTAGHNRSHFFYDVVQKARNVLAGNDLDTSFFATIYECPEGQEETEVGWRAANPSLGTGTTFSVEEFRRDMIAAKTSYGPWQNFKSQRLNIWCQDSAAWIDVGKWDRCEAVPSEAELKAAPAHLAVDLAATTDMTSIAACWHLGGNRHFVRHWGWVSREGVKRRRHEQSNLPRYEQYEKAGELTVSDGDVIDQSRIKAFILDLCRTYKVREVVFDSYNAGLLATELNTVVPAFYFSQNYKMFTSPVKEFEKAIAEQRIGHDGSSLMRWAIGNTRLDVDTSGNCKPSRGKSSDKIDPVVASLMAFARSSQNAVESVKVESVYSRRPIMRF